MLAKLIYLWPLFLLGASGNVCEGEGCARHSARIVGGERSEQNGRPFQVALYSRVGTTGELGFCGGSLLSQEWIITAAHCLFHDGEEVNHVQAILGAHSLYDRYENGRRVVIVDELVVHPDYDPDTFTNDIALVKLANVVQLSDMINTIQLPYRSISSFNFAGQGGTVSGWGIAADGVVFISPTLRQKLMTVITDSVCNVYYFNELPQNTMCAFHGGAGTCKPKDVHCWTKASPKHRHFGRFYGIQRIPANSYRLIPTCGGLYTATCELRTRILGEGDNGGPLTIFYNATEEVILVGVASFISADGCNHNQPSVFTRVQIYLDWISEITGVEII